VNIVSAIANSWVIKTFNACSANVRSSQWLGNVAGAVGAVMTVACFLGDRRRVGVLRGGLIVFGTAPGVLFCVTVSASADCLLGHVLQLDFVFVKLVVHSF
jgi:hypothetical protein